MVVAGQMKTALKNKCARSQRGRASVYRDTFRLQINQTQIIYFIVTKISIAITIFPKFQHWYICPWERWWYRCQKCLTKCVPHPQCPNKPGSSTIAACINPYDCRCKGTPSDNSEANKKCFTWIADGSCGANEDCTEEQVCQITEGKGKCVPWYLQTTDQSNSNYIFHSHKNIHCNYYISKIPTLIHLSLGKMVISLSKVSDQVLKCARIPGKARAAAFPQVWKWADF